MRTNETHHAVSVDNKSTSNRSSADHEFHSCRNGIDVAREIFAGAPERMRSGDVYDVLFPNHTMHFLTSVHTMSKSVSTAPSNIPRAERNRRWLK